MRVENGKTNTKYFLKTKIMKKTLNDYCNELTEISFDKRKAQGLVKRANKDGYNIYFAYHEDESNTWRNGWASSDYKENDSDVKLFEATTLIQKKKPSASFTRAQTYTAECAIFIFCPLKAILEDADLREMQINSIKRKAAKHAEADYKNVMEKKAKYDEWLKLPEDNRVEIEKLQILISENRNYVGASKVRGTLHEKIKQLGGEGSPLVEWQIETASFLTLEDFIQFKQGKAVYDLLKEGAVIEEN